LGAKQNKLKSGDLVKVIIVHPNARHPLYRGSPGLVLGIQQHYNRDESAVIVLAPGGEIDVWQSDELEVVNESR
jgi:hypothetical protein